MKALFIYNPTVAKKSFTDFLDYIIEQFQSYDIELVFHRFCNITTLEETILKLKERQEEFSKVIIAGDESTINHVVNLLVRHEVDLELGFYPIGPFNSFTYQLGLNGTIQEQTKVILEGSPTFCDIGNCNGHYFINALSIGTFSTATPIEIDTTTNKYFTSARMLLILNTQGTGNFNVVGASACPRDGLLDIYVFQKKPAMNLLELIFDALIGKLKGNPNIDSFRTKELTLRAPEGTQIEINGVKVSDFPLTITIIPGRLKVIVASDFEEKENKKNYYLPSYIETKAKGQIPSALDLADVIKNIPHQHTFHYGNKNTLNTQYFRHAKKSFNEPYLYIVFSNTGSPACNLVSIITGQKYGHISLAFDKELTTLASFNGGYGKYKPGLNPEPIEVLYQKPDASIMIFRMKVTKEQKRIIMTQMRQINRVGSSYNFTGLFIKRNFLSNIMFCSQFVYTMLDKAGLLYFEKNPNDVSPIDFLENNEEGFLEFISEVNLKDFIEKRLPY